MLNKIALDASTLVEVDTTTLGLFKFGMLEIERLNPVGLITRQEMAKRMDVDINEVDKTMKEDYAKAHKTTLL